MRRSIYVTHALICWHTSILLHYCDVTMGAMVSQATSFTIVYSTVYSGADQMKHQSSAPLAFVWGIHRWPVNSPEKWPVTQKLFPFDDAIMKYDIRLPYFHWYRLLAGITFSGRNPLRAIAKLKRK